MLPVCLSFAAGASFAAGLGPVDLPSGYEQVAYIESRGPGIQSDEHVDTGVLPNDGTTCRVGFAWLGGDASGSFLLGSRNAFQDRAFYLSHQPKSNAPEDGFAFSRGDKIVYSSLHGNAYCEAELTAAKKFTLDGVEIGDLSDAAAFDGAYPIWLFALNNAGTVKEAAKMRLYFCDIAEDGVPVRSFVPVRRWGIPGLYDRIGATFYRGVSLLAGPTVSTATRPAPVGYRYVEYVRSSGGELLNTEIVPDSKTDLYVRLRPSDSADVHMVGSRNAYQDRGFGLSNNGGLTLAYGTQVWSSGETHLGEMVDVAFLDQRLFVDGLWKHTFSAETFAGTYPMYVFTVNNGGSPHAQYASIDLAALQIVTNGVLARDFAPVKDGQGTPGLYDFVTRRFFTCSQGTLTAGPVVREVLSLTDERYAQDVLGLHVTRRGGSGAATDITLAYGPTNAGPCAADWPFALRAGDFAHGVFDADLSVTNLPETARYGRLFTQDGYSDAIEIFTMTGRYVRPALPASYRAAAYLWSSNSAMHSHIIDTGYIHRKDTRIECVAEVARVSPEGWTAPFGTRWGADWNNGGGYTFFTSDNFTFVPRYSRSGNKVVGTAGSFPYDTKVRIVTEGDTAAWYSEPGGAKLGELVTTATVDDGVNSMAIFDLNDSSTAGGFNASGSTTAMKLHSFRMIDGGRVRRDFAPCLDPYGEPGLWDSVTETFHGNRAPVAFVRDFSTDLPTTAATYTWTGAGRDDSWTNAANWSRSDASTAAVPGWSSVVVFPAGTWSVKLEGPVGIKSLDLSAANLELRFSATAASAEMLVRNDLTFGAASDPSRQGLWFQGGALRVGGKLVAAAGATDLPLHFVVPQNGYLQTPFTVSGASFTGSVRGRVYVEANSPAYWGGGMTSSPLLAAGTDLTVGNVTLEPLPQRHPKKQSVFAWSGVRALGVTLAGRPRGLLISVE